MESAGGGQAMEEFSDGVGGENGDYARSWHVTHGKSMIADPWGVSLDHLPRGCGVVIATINPKYQASLRESLPALKHKTIKFTAN